MAAAKAAPRAGTAALAHRLRRTTPTQRTPTQTAFLPPSNIQTGRQTDTHTASSPGSHPSLRVPGEVVGCVESTRLCLPLCASVSPWAGERGAWETPRPSWWLGALDQGCCVWGDRKGGGEHTRRGTYAQGECVCMRSGGYARTRNVCVHACTEGGAVPEGCTCAQGGVYMFTRGVYRCTCIGMYIYPPLDAMCTQGLRRGEGRGARTPVNTGCANWHMCVPSTPGHCCQAGLWAGAGQGAVGCRGWPGG